MANSEFLTEDIWDQISELSRTSKRCHVAVAYVASAGMKLLRLGKGDVLVVDMSKARVKVGATDPALIRQYMDKGVAVYSLQRLHAKVFVFDKTAVIGSTNVSKYSREDLTEAVILTTDPWIVEEARDFVKALASRLDAVDRDYLARCQKIYRKPVWEPGTGALGHKPMHNWTYKVMKEITSPVSYRPQHGYFISLSKHSDGIGTAYLNLDDGSTGVGTARLNLYPADDIEQAKPFYRNVDITKLKNLEDGRWVVNANLHFGGPFGRGWPPHVSDPPMGFAKYIEFWKSHPEGIRQFNRSELARELRYLQTKGLMMHDPHKRDIDRLRRFKKFGIRPGVSLMFKWHPFVGKLPDPTRFAPKLRATIDEALNTWGDSFA